MAIYMIGYDLHEGQDYENLIQAIKAYRNYWHCLDSTWLVKTDHTSKQIRDYLLDHIRSDDKLLVMNYGSGAAWYGFTGECQTWLQNNL